MSGDPKAIEFATQGCDAALVSSVQTMTTNLLTSFTQAQTVDDRQQAILRYRTGLQLCKDAHTEGLAAINEIFGQP